MVIEAAVPATTRARLVYALHVGGLLHLEDDAFMSALAGSDLVYADGAAVVLLAKVGGARRIERSATTDIGVRVLDRLRGQLGRTPRVALVGGQAGLADRAGAALEQHCDVSVVLTSDGFFRDDAAVLDSLRESKPDVILVGMGMPYEAKWTHVHREELPPAVVMTCGGWFGFLTGDERRAPPLMRRTGMEWAYRLRQDYRRLASRYRRGVVVFVRLLPGQFRRRRATR